MGDFRALRALRRPFGCDASAVAIVGFPGGGFGQGCFLRDRNQGGSDWLRGDVRRFDGRRIGGRDRKGLRYDWAPNDRIGSS